MSDSSDPGPEEMPIKKAVKQPRTSPSKVHNDTQLKNKRKAKDPKPESLTLKRQRQSTKEELAEQDHSKRKTKLRRKQKVEQIEEESDSHSDTTGSSGSDEEEQPRISADRGENSQINSGEEDSESGSEGEEDEGESNLEDGNQSAEEEGDEDSDTSDDDGQGAEADEQDGGTHNTTVNEDEVDKGYAKLREELSNMPFGELQELKEKIGIKLYNQVMFGQTSTSSTKAVSAGRPGKKRFKRENKNRPMEVSSKVRPRNTRQIVPVKKQMVRDPRFDDLSGEYKEDIFKSTYSFLGDVKKNEKQKLLKTLSKEKDEEKRDQLEYLVRRVTAQEKADRNRDQQKERDRQRKKKERSLVSEGKTPFYLKKSDKKKLELAEKYKELQKSGKVDAYLSKKRKKNAQKERRNLPRQ